MLVNECQNTKPAAILGLVFEQIPAPHLPRTLRTLPLCRREPQPAHSALTFADSKPFFASDTRHSLGVNLKAFPPQQSGNPAVTIPRMLVAKLYYFFAHPALLQTLPALTIKTRSRQSQSPAS
jgi:hypothetical protein